MALLGAFSTSLLRVLRQHAADHSLQTVRANWQQTDPYQKRPDLRYLLLHQCLLAECTSAPQQWFDDHKSQIYQTLEELRMALAAVVAATADRGIMFRVYFRFISQYINDKATKPELDKRQNYTDELRSMLSEGRLPYTLQASILLHLGVSKCLDVSERAKFLKDAAQRMSHAGGNMTIILLRLLAVLLERRKDEASVLIQVSDIQLNLPPGPYCTIAHKEELSLAEYVCTCLNELPGKLARRDSIQYDLALSDLEVRRHSYRTALLLAQRAAAQAAVHPEITFDRRCALARVENIVALQQLAG